MIGNIIEMRNLILIYNENINRKCVDICEEIRREILRLLVGNTKMVGIISDSRFYTVSIELYKIKGLEAVSFAYLHLRYRDNNKVWCSISYQDNDIGNEIAEFEYTSVKLVASLITKSLLGMNDYR